MGGPSLVSQHDAVETYLWVDEHNWLKALLRSPGNGSPQFTVPDLIGACVALVFSREGASAIVFRYLCSNIVLRDRRTPRRRERMWRDHFELLHELQRSAANRYPNPSFSLDQLTTACVAIVRESGLEANAIFDQARMNTAKRATRPSGPGDGSGF